MPPPEDSSPRIRCERCHRFVPLSAAVIVGEERRPYCAMCEAVRLGIISAEEADVETRTQTEAEH